MRLEEEHKPGIYLPLLCEPFQHSTKSRGNCKKPRILPKYNKIEAALEDVEKTQQIVKEIQ